MRILHIIDDMNMGGAQSLLVELAPVQKALGHDVVVLELASSSDATLGNKLRENGIEVHSISTSRSVRNPLNILSIIPYLRNCDIAHVHLFPANYWTAIAKLISFCKTPIVTTEHSTDNKRRKIGIFKYLDSFIYRRYNKVIACSNKALETFKARYNRVDCISIPNGVNISKYRNAQPYSKKELINVSEDTFITTMVARFAYPKRQDTLVEAISLLPDRFHSILVGGTPEDDGVVKIKELANTLGVGNRIHFLYIRSDVPRILKSSDAVVMLSEYEGLSLSSIEGMACGHPFIASDVNGLREVVSGAGELVESGNAKALADTIHKLATDANYYEDVTTKCISRANEYDIKNVCSKYMETYAHLINNTQQ